MTKIGMIISVVLAVLDYLNFIDFSWFEIATPFLIGLGIDIFLTIIGVLGVILLTAYENYKEKKAKEYWLNKKKNKDW